MSYKKSEFRSLAMVSQLGLSVVTPILLCTFAGYYIDSCFGTNTLVPLLLLGTLAGARSAWLLVTKLLKAEEQEREQMEQAQKEHQRDSNCQKPKEASRIRREKTDTDEEEEEDGMA